MWIIKKKKRIKIINPKKKLFFVSIASFWYRSTTFFFKASPSNGQSKKNLCQQRHIKMRWLLWFLRSSTNLLFPKMLHESQAHFVQSSITLVLLFASRPKKHTILLLHFLWVLLSVIVDTVSSAEHAQGTIVLDQISTETLDKVIQYFYYKLKYQKDPGLPFEDFKIPQELALDILKAGLSHCFIASHLFNLLFFSF